MKLHLDFHIHSEKSHDGRMTPAEIAAIARARGLDAVAICDHDVPYEGPSEVDGILIVPGIEISTDCGHLLGLFFDTPPMPIRDFHAAAREIHKCGGLTVLAHPFQRNPDTARLLPLLPELDGMEVWNGRGNRKNPRANAAAKAFAAEHGLRPFAGSDAHLPEEIGNGVVTLEVPERSLAALREAVSTAPVEISGKCGKDLYVAKSQWTKLRKTKASPLRYGKWAAFAALCILRDAAHHKDR